MRLANKNQTRLFLGIVKLLKIRDSNKKLINAHHDYNLRSPRACDTTMRQ